MTEAEPRRYAGFWRRTVAALIDGLFFSTLSGVLLIAFYGPNVFADEEIDGLAFVVVSALINNLLPLMLTVFCWIHFLATPGKMLLGCQVVDAESGKRLTFRQAMLRYICYIVSIAPLGLGLLWVAWDKRKQGFHDKIAKTLVMIEDESLKGLDELERDIS